MSMVMDQEYERHLETWKGFTRLLKWAIILIILTLAGLAIWVL